MIPGTSVGGRLEQSLMRSANMVKIGRVKDNAIVDSRYLLGAFSPEILERWRICIAEQE